MRDAALRSMTTLAFSPPCSESVDTSASCGSCCRRSRIFGVHSSSSRTSLSETVYWYIALLRRPPVRKSCDGTRNTPSPGIFANSGRNRSMTWKLDERRSSEGFSDT